MRKLPAAIGAFALATVATLSTSSPALAAAGDFGNGCAADNGQVNQTYLLIANAGGSPLPAAAPSTGVITKATITLPAGAFAFSSKVKVARGTGAPNQYTVQAESTPITIGGGTQSYAVRVPVTAGVLLGLGGATSFSCTSAGATIATLTSDAVVGSPQTYTPAPNTALPVVATVEPDADHDGFGDVTQDLCPQSAATHAVCPSVKSFAAASGNQITVVVAADGPTSVKVTGLAKANGKKIKLKGGTKSVTSGVLVAFKVKVPAALKAALAALPAGRTIKVKLTATGSIPGPHATATSSVKLHGTHH